MHIEARVTRAFNSSMEVFLDVWEKILLPSKNIRAILLIILL
ncbi:hypothetical protein KRR40_03755 [Niabella defluvii]|nr:hypothetical protein KRR40_03755 [Niabella sp. I65]